MVNVFVEDTSLGIKWLGFVWMLKIVLANVEADSGL